MHLLGNVYVLRGDFRSAVPLHDRALAIRQRLLTASDPAVGDSLDRLAFSLVRLDTQADAKRATRAIDQSLKVREATLDVAPLALANTLEVQALRDRYSATYADGLLAIERSLAIRRRLTPEHPSIVSSLYVRGDILWLQGDVAGAADTYREALALGEATLHPRHPVVVVLLRMLGLTAAAFGNLAEARQLRERSVDAAGGLASCHPEATGVLSDLALSLRAEGDYIGAEKLYRRALERRELCLGVIHARTATTVFNLANLLDAMGDLKQAERLQQRAAHDWSASVGPMHPYVGLALDAQAQTVTSQGDLARAELLFKRALAIRRKGLGRNHPDIAATLVRLASLTDTLGRSQQALLYLSEAAAIYSHAKISDQPHLLSGLLMVRGNIEARRGDFEAARHSFDAALAERERMYGPMHPLAAETRAELAALDIAQGRLDRALSNALSAEEIGRAHLRAVIPYLPERQAMAYASRRPKALDLAVSVATLDPHTASGPVFDAVIESRAVVLEELIGRNAARTSIPQTAVLYSSALRARQRYANLLVKTLQEPVSPALLEEARQQKDDAERALAENNVESRSEISRERLGLKEIDAALPRDSVLVSFVTFDLTDVVPKGQHRPSRKPPRYYGAFVHKAGAPDVTFVQLGMLASIDRLITRWRVEAGSPGPTDAYRIAAVELRRAVWDPISTQLKGANRIFIVPDGQLSIVALGALPGRNARFLAEGDSTIHYLSAERDLISQPRVVAGRGLLAVGGAAFDGGLMNAQPRSLTLRTGCNEFGGIRFSDLPGSRREVTEISKFWPQESGDGADVLSGLAATETAVKQNLQGRRIVHFATHGFFLSADCVPTTEGTRSVGGLAKKSPLPRKTTTRATENPLLLSGLAFAGANQRRSAKADQDDGILTAEEIGGLNLQGTEWAVLSACDTGLGEIKAGEGVFGLRRAFQVAGARTVIMSLWSVEDRSAMQWMRALYEGRLRRGLDTAEAVRAASLAVLAERRARGQSTHPFYWAGFVAAGDWR